MRLRNKVFLATPLIILAVFLAQSPEETIVVTLPSGHQFRMPTLVDGREITRTGVSGKMLILRYFVEKIPDKTVLDANADELMTANIANAKAMGATEMEVSAIRNKGEIGPIGRTEEVHTHFLLENGAWVLMRK